MRYSAPIVDRLTYLAIIVVVLLPPVSFALALKFLGGLVGFPEIALVLWGNLVFVLPVQFFIIESAQERVPSALLYAGSTLGASHWRNIIIIYVPQIASALWQAFLVGFFFSFDELVIATFVIDSARVTVPRKLWDQIHRSMDPTPAVISIFVMTLYLVSALLTQIVLQVRVKRREA
jgi:ABC-type spermidine/putrescine transport system permease subunit II